MLVTIKLKRKLLNQLVPVIISFILGFTISFFYFSPYFLESVDYIAVKDSIKLLDHTTSTEQEIILIVLIFTSFKNLNRRDCIRDTWVKFGNGLRIKHYFAIGTNGLNLDQNRLLEQEYASNNDILFLPELIDNYNNLTLKLIHSFKWISIKYQKENYFLLKADDDTFVRLDLLYSELLTKHKIYQKQNLPIYWGYFDGRAHVKKNGPWAEKKWFLCDRYLPYALGGGYGLSKVLVQYIANNAELLATYQSEDVSVGTWLAPLKVKRLHDIQFDTEFKSRGCIDSFLIQHKQSTIDMKSKYKSILEFGRLCPNGEIEYRLAYYYNWDILPTKCCVRNVSMTSR